MIISHLLVMHSAFCTFLSNLDQGFGGRQTEHCCPGLRGGAQEKTSKGIQMEERLRTVLMLFSMRALTLASGMITPALLHITMFVKDTE